MHTQTFEGPFQVIVEWKSTPEFAPVEDIDLMLGVFADEVREGMVYTRAYDGPIANFDNSYYQPGTGKVFVETPNIPYWYDPNPANPLFVIPTAAEAYAGRRVITIDPARYPVGTGVCILSNSTAKTTSAGTSPTGSTSGTLAAGLIGSTTTATLSSSASMAIAGNATASIVGTATADRTTGDGTTATTPNGTVVYLKKSLDSILDDILNGVIDPGPSCVRRTAYTNPVWLKIEPCTTRTACVSAGLVAGVTDVLTADPGDAGGTGGSTMPVMDSIGTIVGTISGTLQTALASPTGTTTIIKGTTSLSTTRAATALR